MKGKGEREKGNFSFFPGGRKFVRMQSRGEGKFLFVLAAGRSVGFGGGGARRQIGTISEPLFISRGRKKETKEKF